MRLRPSPPVFPAAVGAGVEVDRDGRGDGEAGQGEEGGVEEAVKNEDCESNGG